MACMQKMLLPSNLLSIVNTASKAETSAKEGPLLLLLCSLTLGINEHHHSIVVVMSCSQQHWILLWAINRWLTTQLHSAWWRRSDENFSTCFIVFYYSQVKERIVGSFFDWGRRGNSWSSVYTTTNLFWEQGIPPVAHWSAAFCGFTPKNAILGYGQTSSCPLGLRCSSHHY